MASNNPIITLGHLKGPGVYASSPLRRFLCGNQACPGGGSKARPDELQRHVSKVHGEVIDYATVRVQEEDPITHVATIITADQYVNRIWAAAGLAVPPARRFRIPGLIAPAPTTVPTTNIIAPAVSQSYNNVLSGEQIESGGEVRDDTSTDGTEESTSEVDETTDPRIGMFRSLVAMTTRLADWLIAEGIDRSQLQALADRVGEETSEASVMEADEDED